jgi:hypothetical protein
MTVDGFQKFGAGLINEIDAMDMGAVGENLRPKRRRGSAALPRVEISVAMGCLFDGVRIGAGWV